MTILEVSRRDFLSLIKEGYMIIFKEDIQTSKLMAWYLGTSSYNDGGQQDPRPNVVEEDKICVIVKLLKQIWLGTLMELVLTVLNRIFHSMDGNSTFSDFF